jgi:WD40 repeat protein
MSWKLSTECSPAPEGEVHAVAALSDDIIISGSNDHMVSVWKRLPGTLDFATIHICPEHQHQLRAVLALPPGPLLPNGGFATAGLDKTVRVYSLDGEKVCL